jgi:hypothetical protein
MARRRYRRRSPVLRSLRRSWRRMSSRERGGLALVVALVVFAGAGHTVVHHGHPATAEAATTATAPSGALSGNVALGQRLASGYGWASGPQWTCLYNLWQQESGWSNTAENPSDAYGIAQALGHGPTNQYPAGPANPPVSSASAQIRWGLAYVSGTYGTPCGAWSHEVADGWY